MLVSIPILIMKSKVFALAFAASTGIRVVTASSNNTIVSIDSQLSYRLLPDFEGNITENFIDTETSNATTASVLTSAQTAPFISYDSDFLSIIGPNPSLTLIAQRATPFAVEAGIWLPDRNEVWFTSATVNDSGSVWALDLASSTIYEPATSIPIITPNGGYYFNGVVYITSQGTLTDPPCIYGIDPQTGATEVVVNSYFGVRFGGPNDVTWVKRGNNSYMFFTDDPLSQVYAGGEVDVLPDAVWRYDPQEQSIVPVISRADILVPNGITVNADMSKLYVTDTTAIGGLLGAGGGASNSGSPAIYSFDLDEDLFPINKRMLGISRRGVPDGLHVDDGGNIYTGEYEGIVVRSPKGKVIGVINSEVTVGNQTFFVENFALAGDILVLLDGQRLWTLQLAEQIVSPDRYWSS
jgi:gluconolactonase